MTQADVLYKYLQDNYKKYEPIFMSEINAPEIVQTNLRPLMKRLTEDGRLKRFDTGIYYIPGNSLFRSGSTLSVESVIRKKYITEENECCGYIGGILFANQLGLTTQVPAVYEVTTNKATTEYRETQLGNVRVIIRRPYVQVTEQNVGTLQFLDLLKDVDDVSELQGTELTLKLISYMKKKNISFDALRPFLRYYPDKIYKNMYEAGLLNGVLA